MPKVLTAKSTLTCLHQGTVQLMASQSVLKVDGQAVLVQGDLEGKLISGCKTPVSQTTKPCMTVVAMSVGTAMALKAGNKPVLLETAMGTTDGLTPAPTNMWNVQTAGQTKLDAR
jgi:hypothetical protein